MSFHLFRYTDHWSKWGVSRKFTTIFVGGHITTIPNISFVMFYHEKMKLTNLLLSYIFFRNKLSQLKIVLSYGYLCPQTRHTRKHVGGDRRRPRRCRGHRLNTALHGLRPSSSRRGLFAATRWREPNQPQSWKENELWRQCLHILPVMLYGRQGIIAVIIKGKQSSLILKIIRNIFFSKSTGNQPSVTFYFYKT